MAWPLAPRGCTIWVPEHAATLASLGELAWRACPFQAEGCAALGAPWAARTGWGYGGRLGAVAAGDRTYLTFVRQLDEGVWETVILGGATVLAPVAAWRQRLPEAGCVLGTPSLTSSAERVTAALPILRREAETAPLVVLGAPEALAAPQPGALAALVRRGGGWADEATGGRPRVEAFGGPGAPGTEVLARDVAIRRGDLLVVWEHEGRFAVRDLASGRTTRPRPRDASAPGAPGGTIAAALLDATPVGDAVVFNAWTGARGSVWSADRWGGTAPLLGDARASYDRFTTDGTHAVWTRSTGRRDLNTFAHVELWTGRLQGGALVEPRKLRTLPPGALPLVSVGEGWAALWRPAAQAVRSPDDPAEAAAAPTVVLVRLSDGALRRLPAVPQLAWDGGSGGLAIAGGAVWARASLRGRAGNDHRLIARFALEALPKGTLR